MGPGYQLVSWAERSQTQVCEIQGLSFQRGRSPEGAGSPFCHGPPLLMKDAQERVRAYQLVI